MRERLEMAQQMDDLLDKGFVSKKYIRQIILKQSEEDIERLDQEVEEEAAEGENEEDMDMDFESTEIAPDNNITENDEVVEQREDELHEAQLKMIDSMTKVLAD